MEISRGRHFKQLVKANSLDRDVGLELDLPYSFAKNFIELASLVAIIRQAGIELHRNKEKNSFELSYFEQLNPEEISSLESTWKYLRKLVSLLPEEQKMVIEFRYFSSVCQ